MVVLSPLRAHGITGVKITIVPCTLLVDIEISHLPLFLSNRLWRRPFHLLSLFKRLTKHEEDTLIDDCSDCTYTKFRLLMNKLIEH